VKAEPMNARVIVSLFCLVLVGCMANPVQEQPPNTFDPEIENGQVQLESNVSKNDEGFTQESHANTDSYRLKSQEPTQSRQPHISLEYQLATIDKGYVSDTDPTITRFRSLLEQLSSTYVENRQSIADMTVAAQKLLREKYGISESLLTMMEGMNKVLYQRIPNQKYAEYITVYIQFRNKGMSHDEAVAGLAALIQSFSGR